MTHHNQICAELKRRFTWESDGRLDSYHIMPATGPVRGDCDDFAATILAELTGRSWARFWWWLVSGKARFWLVIDPAGQRHVTLWVRGLGHTDNWRNAFSETEDLHKPLRKVRWPEVLGKLLIGAFDKT